MADDLKKLLIGDSDDEVPEHGQHTCQGSSYTHNMAATVASAASASALREILSAVTDRTLNPRKAVQSLARMTLLEMMSFIGSLLLSMLLLNQMHQSMQLRVLDHSVRLQTLPLQVKVMLICHQLDCLSSGST